MRYGDESNVNRKSRIIWNLIAMVVLIIIVILGILEILPLYLGISLLAIGILILLSTNFIIFRDKRNKKS